MATLTAPLRSARPRELARRVVRDSSEHELLTYASAISFRAIVAFVPLALLGLGLLGAFGLQDFWRESVAPVLQERLTEPMSEGVNASAEKVFRSSTAGLIAFASALLLWDMTWAVDVTRRALNTMHDVEERRPWRRWLATSILLATAVSACLIGSVLVVILAPRVFDGGALNWLLMTVRWPVAVVLLGLAVGLLFRYAPAERPEVRWASAGSVFVIATWILASLLFRWWVGSVADFKSATGTLTVLLVLTAYTLTSVAIFLVGAQLNETLRARVRRGAA